MLSFTDKFTIPGISNIDFYRDHQKQDVIYAIRSTPVIKRDSEGKLAFGYNFIARNADIAYASSANKELVETQLGQMLLTVDLSLTPKEEEIAIDYLRKMLNDTKNVKVRSYLKRYRRKQPSKKIEPRLAAPQWKDGNVALQVLQGLGDTFTKSFSEQVKPSLVGWNAASLYATYGIEGAQLMRDALIEGFKSKDGETEKTPIQAIVRYTGKAVGWIQDMEVKVFASSAKIYDFLQTQTNNYRKDVQQGKRTRTKKIGGWTYSSKTTIYDKKIDIDKTEIHRLVETMRENKVISVEINDNIALMDGSPEQKEVQQELMAMVMDVVMNKIIGSFFETAMIAEKDGKEEETDTTTTSGAQPNTSMNTSWRDRRIKNQDHYYYFRNDVDKKNIQNIIFSFKKNSTIEFPVNPNGSLFAQLTESERKASVRTLDISSPEIQMMEVQVTTNADFEADNIHSVIVNVRYKQKDHKSGVVRENSKSYMFQDGTEVFIFRVTLARNEKDELIDFYEAEAKISYKGTAKAPPSVLLENISDKKLVVSYNRLGFVTVKATAGDIDWSAIKEAVVDFEYMAEPDKPDAKKQIRLNQETLTGNWKCFMYGHEDKKYRYKVKYFYLDGTESETEFKEDTRDSLIIDDNLIGRAKASFDVLMDPNTVTTAKVEIIYKDEPNQVTEEFSKWFTGSETWDWSMRLRENATKSFVYRHFVQYKDGLVKTSKWMDASSDEDIPPLDFKRYNQTLTVDGGMLDWNKWRMVYVNVKYEDKDSGYLKQDTLRLDRDTIMQPFEILSFHAGQNQYECTLKFAGSDGVIDVPNVPVKGGILILEDPVSESPLNDPLPPDAQDTSTEPISSDSEQPSAPTT